MEGQKDRQTEMAISTVYADLEYIYIVSSSKSSHLLPFTYRSNLGVANI